MIEKHDRIYIKHWFNDGQKFNEGDTLEFEMPSFVTGDFTATIHLDNDNDPYIHKDEDYHKGCRDFFIDN